MENESKKLWRWTKGRQRSGYDVLPLVMSKYFSWDLYIIRYTEGSMIPFHRDPVQPNMQHHRLNIILSDCEVGGNFIIVNNKLEALNQGSFLGFKWIKFRPDLVDHMVTEVMKGTRLVISFGYLKKDK